MAEIVVIEAPMDGNLPSFSRYLWQQKVPHRIVENNDRQLLLVGSRDVAAKVAVAYKHFCNGDEETIDAAKTTEQGLLALHIGSAPITVLLMLLSIIGYLIVSYDSDYQLLSQLTFAEFRRSDGRLTFVVPAGEYWRLITPIFLHFSILHIVFNTLWLWDLGRRVEILQGSGRMVALVLIIGLGSNIAQYIWDSRGVFGGMSGVIYGLLGYGWIWSTLRPDRSMQIPQVIINFMLGWLLVCVLGFASLLGAGEIANAAHVGGLLMGMILGFAAGKFSTPKDSEST